MLPPLAAVPRSSKAALKKWLAYRWTEKVSRQSLIRFGCEIRREVFAAGGRIPLLILRRGTFPPVDRDLFAKAEVRRCLSVGPTGTGEGAEASAKRPVPQKKTG